MGSPHPLGAFPGALANPPTFQHRWRDEGRKPKEQPQVQILSLFGLLRVHDGRKPWWRLFPPSFLLQLPHCRRRQGSELQLQQQAGEGSRAGGLPIQHPFKGAVPQDLSGRSLHGQGSPAVALDAPSPHSTFPPRTSSNTVGWAIVPSAAAWR